MYRFNVMVVCTNCMFWLYILVVCTSYVLIVCASCVN